MKNCENPSGNAVFSSKKPRFGMILAQQFSKFGHILLHFLGIISLIL
jgi:hypothetical protein